ncbi:unnamed protein product, partial [Cladocopium goreaui]
MLADQRPTSEALAAGSNVDFPKAGLSPWDHQVTEICERVAKEPQEAGTTGGTMEAAEAVRLLAGAFAENGPPRRLLYNPRAVEEMRRVVGVRDTLWKLQATSNSGLGDASDEQIRMFATEVEKKCFGNSGDPFQAPAPLVPEEPWFFSQPLVEADNLKTGLAAAQEAKGLLKSQGSRLEIPKLPVRPLSERPNLDISFDDILPGEKVHYSISPSVLPINKPFRTLKDKLAWVAEKQLLDVPLGLIEKLDYEGVTSEAGVQQWRLTVTTKDFRSLMILVPQAKDLVMIEEAVLALSQPGEQFTKALFAFSYAASMGIQQDEGWNLYSPGTEFQRMGVGQPGCPWKISALENSYQLCSTYPAVLVLPAETSDEQLQRVAAFRKRGRLPTLSWCSSSFASLWRCAQPMEGLLGQPESSDERMLSAIRKAAYANKCNGGGFENYDGCRLVFGNIDNVHGVRYAWKKMGQAVSGLSNDEVGSWFKDVANSGWYDIMGAIFQCANMVIHEIDVLKCNVLIHCSDGWDRTAQVSSVAMLCMDPHYRTLRGLLLLIQKDAPSLRSRAWQEFCSFGHRFRTRLANGEKPTSEYSPIFLQWLECVHQMTQQFPTAFEFTSSLLLHLGREVLTNRWGTFLGDCEQERSKEYWFRFRIHPRDELTERIVGLCRWFAGRFLRGSCLHTAEPD